MLDETDPRVTAAAEICASHAYDPAELIEILHELQDREGYIAEETLPAIAQLLNISRAEVHGVVSFYHDFRREPAGKVVVKICRAESCQSMGASKLIARICERYNTDLGTTSRAGVTIEQVFCLGLCAQSPAAMLNGRFIGHATEEGLDTAIVEALS
ncbi:NAD(P)H-dependent oxidoreductase subunit E [Amaricoccus solimangrovi]|uniref:Formate dehydrogenase subunit gamma n=1 Tax=Amaricoccus solimangrovi TaxID=2589815 RepID=A0A501WPK2_9RHOB|nr:NAD(P)H-dependent oxidoreductase subunit E [Amaricoccus solimangrovi]TPE50782.1 hypothetical protein FJM51_11025 [Amaricoccus solimangrovi]